MVYGISHAANEWLRTGARGISSEKIFSQLTGVQVVSVRWFSTHPRDPSDFWRCRKLLEAVPEFRQRLPEMAQVSPVWKVLVEHWDDLCRLMDAEAPTWPQQAEAPNTYARMKALGC